MASGTAGKWILILVVYLFVLITIITSSANLDSNVTHSGHSLNSSSYIINGSEFVCANPRYHYRGDGELVVNYNDKNTACSRTIATTNESCSELEGCFWDDGEIPFWFDTTAFCNGAVNVSYYNSGSTDFEESICYMDDIPDSETCQRLGCSLVEKESEIEFTKKGVFGVVLDLFTFNADIGLPITYNYLFISFFFYLPFLCLILAVLMYIPTT